MSGGHFDYNQHRIQEVAEQIAEEAARCYDESEQREFYLGALLGKLAYIYAQRIDWLLSGDDGPEQFHARLREEIRKLLLSEEIENIAVNYKNGQVIRIQKGTA